MSGDIVAGRHGRPPQPMFPAYSGPISNHFPGLTGGDFSWALGIVVGSLVYWALAGRSVRQEAAAQVARVVPDP